MSRRRIRRIVSYLREFEHITLTRVLISQYQCDRLDSSFQDVKGLLERLLQAAEVGRRTGSVIEILVLQALAYQVCGDTSSGLASLERALTLAEPEGYQRIFVDEGPSMEKILNIAAKRGIQTDYSGKLLVSFKNIMHKPG